MLHWRIRNVELGKRSFGNRNGHNRDHPFLHGAALILDDCTCDDLVGVSGHWHLWAGASKDGEETMSEKLRDPAIRRLLLPKDTNHRGEVFGGVLLQEIDLAGAVEARKHTKYDVATVAMKEVQFLKPVNVGDVVSFYTAVTKIGKTSIHVKVEVEASRDGRATSEAVTAAELVYVTVVRFDNGTIGKVPVKE